MKNSQGRRTYFAFFFQPSFTPFDIHSERGRDISWNNDQRPASLFISRTDLPRLSSVCLLHVTRRDLTLRQPSLCTD